MQTSTRYWAEPLYIIITDTYELAIAIARSYNDVVSRGQTAIFSLSLGRPTQWQRENSGPTPRENSGPTQSQRENSNLATRD